MPTARPILENGIADMEGLLEQIGYRHQMQAVMA
jgi:hypothetical protein